MNPFSVTVFSLIALNSISRASEVLPFRFPDAIIRVAIDSTNFTSSVACNVSEVRPSGERKYMNGFAFTEETSSKGMVRYEFVGPSQAGDVYVFTIERLDKKTEVFPYIFSGTGEALYSKKGIVISIQSKG